MDNPYEALGAFAEPAIWLLIVLVALFVAALFFSRPIGKAIKRLRRRR